MHGSLVTLGDRAPDRAPTPRAASAGSRQMKPNPYDPECSSRRALERIGGKWSILIVNLLRERTMRFAELQRGVDGISQKMLTQTLRGLERDGLVERTAYPEVPPRVEYRLTPLGRTLVGPSASVVRWTENHIQEVERAQARYDSARGAAR
jgi:DNA-binding HxlR family transcriptional regulator